MPTAAIIYADDNFSGASQLLSVADYDQSMILIGNDKLSSIKVSPGYAVTLYRNPGFSGDTRLVVADARMADLYNGFNDQTSSIRVREQVGASLPHFGTCYIQTGSGRVFAAVNGGGNAVRADRTVVGDWETFIMIPCGPGKVALMASNGQFVCAENGGGTILVADRDERLEWETFNLIDLGYGKIALQAHNGKYVCALGNGGGDITATANAIGEWETFRVFPLANFTTEGAPCRVRPRLRADAYNGDEIHLTKNDDNSVSITLNDQLVRQQWRVVFATGNYNNGGTCVFIHAASGRLLSAPNDKGHCTTTTTLDRSSLFSVVTIPDAGTELTGYRVVRPVRNFDMNLNVPWDDTPNDKGWLPPLNLPLAAQVWSWSNGDYNEIWIW
ncbi:MAG TPA: hypothetical protein PK156_34125 [Polyangium sp.]|nr:hypothetical protein [Polyangium sp.]